VTDTAGVRGLLLLLLLQIAFRMLGQPHVLYISCRESVQVPRFDSPLFTQDLLDARLRCPVGDV